MIDWINPNVEEIKQQDLLKHIELCGRVCYKSEDKITEDSAEKFVNNLITRGHTSVLEHGTVYLDTPESIGMIRNDIERQFISNILWSPYTYCTTGNVNDHRLLTTNFRVVVDAVHGSLAAALKIVSKYEPKYLSQFLKRKTFRITCDRGVSHELVRHRVFSFSQESTRYVNYNKKGFQFIKPAWWNDEIYGKEPANEEEARVQSQYKNFLYACQEAVEYYENLTGLGQTPQQARAVLPNAVKTEVVMTGTTLQWEKFLELRTDKAAHPDMQVVANKIKELL